jgi:hypothetical protein
MITTTLKILPVLALAMIASSASAITTFATFSPETDGNVSYTGTSSGVGAITSIAAPVTFRFINSSPLGYTDFAASTFNLAINTTAGAVFGGTAIVPVSTGTLSFIAPTLVTYNGKTGSNLLSARFTQGAVTGNIGGSTANYGTSTPPYTVNFTSDFIDFSTATANDLSLAINAISPLLSSSGTGVANFTGTIAGNFGSDVLGGGGNPNGTVPEPAAWALMVVGFGLVGGASRRRSRMSVTA